MKRSKVWTYILRQGAASLPLLFVGYYVDVNFYCHSHIINGVTIIHSHVHDKHHGNTATELTLIANMDAQFFSTGEIPETEWAAINTLILTLGCEQALPTASIHLSCPSLRAPPAC